MIAQLGRIVRGRSGSTCQFVGRIAEILYQLIAGRSCKVFQDRTFIENHAAEQVGVDILHVVVIRDIDARREVLIEDRHAQLRNFISEFLALLDGLDDHREGREDQHGAVDMSVNLIGPFELLDGLAEAAVLKEREFTRRQSAFHTILLKVEKHRIQVRFFYGKPAFCILDSLLIEKFQIFFAVHIWITH